MRQPENWSKYCLAQSHTLCWVKQMASWPATSRSHQGSCSGPMPTTHGSEEEHVARPWGKPTHGRCKPGRTKRRSAQMWGKTCPESRKANPQARASNAGERAKAGCAVWEGRAAPQGCGVPSGSSTDQEKDVNEAQAGPGEINASTGIQEKWIIQPGYR